jgi:hypothetical protein
MKEYLGIPSREERRLFRDPERWADADLTREEWLLLAKHRAALALAVTIFVIGFFLFLSG